MNVSFDPLNKYGIGYQSARQGRDAKGSAAAGASSGLKKVAGKEIPSGAAALELKNRSIRDRQEQRRKIRELERSESKKSGVAADPLGLLETTEASDEKEKEKSGKPVNYNYKEVSNKIRSAKNPVSAEKAVLAAKRKTMELRRKISAKEGDPEELQLALNHARSMELVARKKKHHLELEEMAEHVQRADEAKDKTEEAEDRLRGCLIGAEEEKLTEREEEILGERTETMEEAAEELQESAAASADEMLSELNEMLSEFGEEELEELESAMELLEDMEFLDPHMSEEELKEVKTKHRASENKSLVKADMDYLKAMIKHQLAAGKSIPGMSGSTAGAVSFGAAFSGGSAAAPSGTPAMGSVSVDVQV
ncbi:MAG: hypothetical protein K6E50_06805 [Lachnospiraceae bacterium]|nr:hypothetical protein [Lachnospiraceae bacterium]